MVAKQPPARVFETRRRDLTHWPQEIRNTLQRYKKKLTLPNKLWRKLPKLTAELQSPMYTFLKTEVFKNEDRPEEKWPLNGWSMGFWDWYCTERKDSCLFFEKSMAVSVIAVDVYFDTTQNVEDAYCMEIFDREGQKQQLREISECSLQPFYCLLKSHGFVWNGYYMEKRNLSRAETVDFLKLFISTPALRHDVHGRG